MPVVPLRVRLHGGFVVKAVSLSHELATIEQAIQGAATLVDLGRHGGLEGEDTGAQTVAILALVATRLRDLGRVARRDLAVEQFWAPHGAVVEAAEVDAEEVVLRPVAVAAKSSRSRR